MEPTSFASAILTALPYFVALEANYLKEFDQKKFKHETFKKGDDKFDFIVVGGGPAGCVVANRLSEHFSVLLFEAGGDPPSTVSVPNFRNSAFQSSHINSIFQSIPGPLARNRHIDNSMGRMLGGTGSHNFMVYCRGNPRDFDNWAQLVNDSSWEYKKLLKYFKKAENYMGIWPIKHQHGTTGPMFIKTSKEPLDRIWKTVASELGYKYIDLSGPQKEGFSPMKYWIEHGRRVSTYTAYIQPIIPRRKRLTIRRYSQVEKLLISNGKVTIVKYSRHGRQFTATTSVEVILCAGALGTPLILFQSGIGSARMLRRARIKPILNLLAVGQYMQDHVGVPYPPLLVNPQSISSVEQNLTKEEFEHFLNHKEDTILSQVGISPQMLYVSSVAKSQNQHGWPDTQIRRTDCASPLPDAKLTINKAANELCLDVIMQRPKFNRQLLGTIRLNSSAYLAGERDNVKLAVIDDNILMSHQDVKVLREGMKVIRKIVRSNAFKKIGALETTDAECGDRHKVNSGQYWECYFSRVAYTHHHTVGTCRMGPDGDRKTSVVNSRLRVHGVHNLRIVDASIMPQIVNANTNAAVVAIAEKGSAMILSAARIV